MNQTAVINVVLSPSDHSQHYDPPKDQIMRQLTLRQDCKNKINYMDLKKDNEIPKQHTSNVIYRDKKSFIFCPVRSFIFCSSNWKRLMLVFDEIIEDPSKIKIDVRVDGYSFNALKKLDLVERRKKSSNYYAFFFVKHPYERLVSAWRNKFNDHDVSMYAAWYKRNILREFRKNLTHNEYRFGWGLLRNLRNI